MPKTLDSGMTLGEQVKFELVIFDCDGVLVDSEGIANTVLAEMLNELGLKVTLEDMFAHFVGHSMSACLKIIEGRLGRPVPEDFVSDYMERTATAFSRELKSVTGIEEVLKNVGIPYCVASSGDYDKMQMTLGLTGLLRQFDGKLFSVSEVARGKPHPDVFLYAAERMGAIPARCAVVEDSELGVRAGVAAGMVVFGYAELSDPKRLSAAGAVVFRDMKRLPRLLRQYGGADCALR